MSRMLVLDAAAAIARHKELEAQVIDEGNIQGTEIDLVIYDEIKPSKELPELASVHLGEPEFPIMIASYKFHDERSAPETRIMKGEKRSKRRKKKR